jgi:hypothetical protein
MASYLKQDSRSYSSKCCCGMKIPNGHDHSGWIRNFNFSSAFGEGSKIFTSSSMKPKVWVFQCSVTLLPTLTVRPPMTCSLILHLTQESASGSTFGNSGFHSGSINRTHEVDILPTWGSFSVPMLAIVSIHFLPSRLT